MLIDRVILVIVVIIIGKQMALLSFAKGISIAFPLKVNCEGMLQANEWKRVQMSF